MYNKERIKIIYKKSLYEQLVRLGHQPVAIEKNYKNDRFYVYKFIKTPQLAADLSKIFGNES